jgi:hypothetical protein
MLGSLRAVPVAGLLAVGLAAGPAAPAAGSQYPGTWAKTGSMTTPRQNQTAILLHDGQVLVIGGTSTGPGAELYNPATGKWAATGNPPSALPGATAALLPDGQVLVAGGAAGFTATSGAELFTPATGTWAATGRMSFPRSGQLDGLLPDGQVLVVCGVDDPGVPACAAELYTLATGTWAQDGQAGPSASRDFSAVLLGNGLVLFSGGENGVYPRPTTVAGTASLFDPATATSTGTGSMTIPRAFHTLTVLPDGQVLAAGGQTQNNKGQFSTTAGAELYTP